MTYLDIYQNFTELFKGWSQAWAAPGLKQYFGHMEQQAFRLEYDFLFRGTDGDIRLPLWASVCSGHGEILCDSTTLKVIEVYYRWGYSPVRMEGNPPDYLGEMLRFLVYMASAERYEEGRYGAEGHGAEGHKVKQQEAERGNQRAAAGVGNPSADDGFGRHSAAEARRQFIREFVLENTLALAAALARCRKDSPFELAVRDLAGVLQADLDGVEMGTSDGSYTEPTTEFPKVLSTGPNPPIPMEDEHVIPTAGINNCGGLCVIRPVMREGCMVRIETDESSNNPQLRACVRGRGYRKTFLSSQRLKYPMKRIGERGSGKFERISWEEAADIIAAEWKRIKEAYGVSSRYLIYSTGVTGIMRPGKLAKRLLCLDGGCLDYYNSYSSACAGYVTPYIYGTGASGNSAADVLNTKLLILWGHNPAETVFGSERNFYLSKLKEKGVKVVVIDPRFSDSAAAYGDQWIPLRPSTDSALADGMAYVIWSEGLQDQEFMDRYCLGFDEEHMPEGMPKEENYRAYLWGELDGVVKCPEWAESVTGVPAETIRCLAREYATVKPACLMPGLGLQRTGNGEQTIRSTALLTCLTGNVGIPGGGAAGAGWPREHGGIALFNQPPNPYKGMIPVFQWVKAITRGTSFDRVHDGLEGVQHLDSNIKMLFNLAGNTLVNQHSDINETIRVLKDTSKCEFILCSDIFMTPSARFADLLLPATSVFENSNISNPWSGGNYILRNNQVMEPLFGCRFEWEWLKDVAKRLGYYEAFIDGKEDAESWLKEMYEILRTREPELPEYREFCEAGGWQYREPARYVAFKAQIEDPEHHPFPTPSGKIEIVSPRLYRMNQPDQIPAVPRYVPCPEGPEDPLRERFPLQLIGWHTRRRCHSVHDNNEWMDEVEKPALWIHPEDAVGRGIGQGDMVTVFNDRGRVRIPAMITNRIMEGVVAMSQGGWYTPDQDGTDIRGSINVLTAGEPPSPLAKGNPQHTNLVEVSLN